jgi:hypothetical protein
MVWFLESMCMAKWTHSKFSPKVLTVKTSEVRGTLLTVNVWVFFSVLTSFPLSPLLLELFLSSVHKSKTDFRLKSLVSALYSLLHLRHKSKINTKALVNSLVITPTLIFFFFGGTGVWTQVFMLPKQVLYCFSHTPSPFSSGVSVTYLYSVATNCNPPDLSLQSKKDYQCEPSAPRPTLVI